MMMCSKMTVFKQQELCQLFVSWRNPKDVIFNICFCVPVHRDIKYAYGKIRMRIDNLLCGRTGRRSSDIAHDISKYLKTSPIHIGIPCWLIQDSWLRSSFSIFWLQFFLFWEQGHLHQKNILRQRDFLDSTCPYNIRKYDFHFYMDCIFTWNNSTYTRDNETSREDLMDRFFGREDRKSLENILIKLLRPTLRRVVQNELMTTVLRAHDPFRK